MKRSQITLPELVGRIEYADQITLRMMVQHRSGIPNLTDEPDYQWDWYTPQTEISTEAPGIGTG